jgi:phosphate transport system substrate-binding protein
VNKILLALSALVLAATALAQADVRVDGSSTVYPVTLAVAEEFAIENPDANVSVAFSGTGGGFSKFCAGETQISDASRVVKQSEIDACAAAGIEFVEIPVAFDALTVVVNAENDWAQCMTVDELATAWRAGPGVATWSDIRDGWPDREIEFYAPGVDSGTFDYFVEAIIGEGNEIRTDFFPSEDDNVLVQGVEGNVDALSFFGYAYYLEEQDRLNAVAIDDGAGCVEPSTETIESGTYTPLARPLFIYVAVDAADENPVVRAFVEFYLSEDAREFIADTGYALLDPAAYELSLERFEARESGSVFADAAGKTVLEVLRGE